MGERLWDTNEVADHLGIGADTARRMLMHPSVHFPAPVIDRPDSFLWRADDIETWARLSGYPRRGGPWWDTTAVAAHLGVTRQRVHAILRDGQTQFPPPAIAHPKCYRWHPSDIEVWASRNGYPKARAT